MIFDLTKSRWKKIRNSPCTPVRDVLAVYGTYREGRLYNLSENKFFKIANMLSGKTFISLAFWQDDKTFRLRTYGIHFFWFPAEGTNDFDEQLLANVQKELDFPILAVLVK